MKFLFATLIGATLVITGCTTQRSAATFSEPPEGASTTVTLHRDGKTPAPATTNNNRRKSESESKLIVTPENRLTGTVSVYNSAGRFVVVDFPVGKMPARDQVLSVYRQGLKVGEVRITGPERDHNTVADVISGEAQKGDEVRDR